LVVYIICINDARSNKYQITIIVEVIKDLCDNVTDKICYLKFIKIRLNWAKKCAVQRLTWCIPWMLPGWFSLPCPGVSRCE